MNQLIQDTIENYRKFLINSYPNIAFLLLHLDWDNNIYWLDDWEDINWKKMVEEIVCEKGQLLRGYSPSYLSLKKHNSVNGWTHEITCEKFDSKNKFIFICFGAFKNGSFVREAPFDIIKCADNNTLEISYLNYEDIHYDISII